jgi:hypothetical protein
MTIIEADYHDTGDHRILSLLEEPDRPLRPELGGAMLKSMACFGLAVAIAALPTAAHAVSGTSSSWGSYGAGPTIPTQALSPFDRAWNQSHESQNEAIAGSQWPSEHHAGGTRANPRRYLWHRWYR